MFLGFPGSSAGKESACNVGGLGSIPGSGRSPGGGKGYKNFQAETSLNVKREEKEITLNADCVSHKVGLAQRRKKSRLESLIEG